MSPHAPLTRDEREQIYQAKLNGESLGEQAAKLQCSLECVRKWWRTGREHGLEGLRAVRPGRKKTGWLSRFAACVSERALQYKRQHPRWGPKRVLVELGQDPLLCELSLPGRSTLAAFFKACCPELLASYQKRVPEPPPPRQAQAVHAVWQLDARRTCGWPMARLPPCATFGIPLGQP